MYRIEVRNLDGKVIASTTTKDRDWAAHLYYQFDAQGHIVTIYDHAKHGRICMAN